MRIILFLLGFIYSFSIWGQVISQTEAMSKGMDFLSVKKRNHNLSTKSNDICLNYELVYTAEKNGKICYYVYNCESGGYVIVSADTRSASPILGYSTEGYFDYDGLSPEAKFWMDSYTEQIYSSSNSDTDASAKRKTFDHSILPLLGNISWGQNEPYNLLCPEIGGERCVTGCGPTAMAQIMFYHKWPEKGQGIISYINEGQFIEADLSESTYNWDEMLPVYDSNASTDSQMAVALLMRDCGYAAATMYGIYESPTRSNRGFHWINNFDYDKGIRILPREFFEDEDWEELIWSELEKGRPIIYEGSTNEGDGHIFICDGYDYDGYFHFNFGWDGRENGYYLTSANKFPLDQCITIGLEKNHGGEHVLDFLSASNFIYDEKENLFVLGRASICDVAEGEKSSFHSEDPMIGVAVENMQSEEISYFDGYRYTLWKHPLTRNFDIYNNIVGLKDGEYRIYPVCKINEEPNWIPCQFKKGCEQQYVSLKVSGGKYSFQNELLNQEIDNGIACVNGIYYQLNKEELTASVTITENMRGTYKGEMVIPEKISVNNITYTVDAIGDSAFEGSEHLHFVSIPRTVKRIGKRAFNGTYVYELLFPEDAELEYIDEGAFCFTRSLKKLDIPQKTKIIGEYAFSYSSLESISIPKSVTQICDYAFINAHLKEIFVHWTEPLEINYNVFESVDPSQINLYVPKGKAEYYNQISPWLHFSIQDGNEWTEEEIMRDNIHYLLRTPNMTATIIHVNPTDNTTIAFPESITFNNQNYLVTEIEEWATQDNNEITEIFIPKSIKHIRGYAFRNLDKLIKVEFDGDSKLKSIGSCCFDGCNNLEYISLPKTLVNISSFAFNGCNKLKEIDLPASLTYIEQSAFESCRSLSDVTVHWLKPLEINSMAFAKNDYSKMSLHVPIGTKEDYHKTKPWSLFGQIIEDIEPSFEYLVESITLSPNIWNGEEGEAFKIKATIFPENASYKAITWSSSDESIAIVTQKGEVHIINEGSCIITATALDGSGAYAQCSVSSGAGINGISSENQLFDIYNLNGILIMKDCTKDSLNNLPAALYILRCGNKITKMIIR